MDNSCYTLYIFINMKIDGEDGGKPTAGTDGQDGSNALPVYVKLDGDQDNMKVGGSFNGALHMGDQIPNNPSILWINARGSRAGDGGAGGKGGDGGNGGDGGHGGEPENVNNGNEFIGGRGGDGGNGGNATDGGNGGSAGNGGRGGNVLIETTNPKLLMFVEVDIRGGEPGIPGIGGKGGRCGKGGKAGSAFLTYIDQMKGNDGRMGQNGDSGKDGKSGRSGQPGSVYYVVLGQDGIPIEEGYKKYTVKVIDYRVEGCIDDGVFEPGEELLIKDITLYNDGDLTLPKGCALYLKETESFEPIDSDHLLPEIVPGQKITIKFNLRGRIKPIPSPTKPGRYSGLLDISTYCELLNKNFRDSEMKKQIEVTYPIQLARFSCPNALAINEVSTFKVEIANVSNVPYGSSSDSKESIEYRVIFDDYFALPEHSESSFVGSISKLAPRSTKSIEFKVKLRDNASYYQQLKWRIELSFRGQLIEFTDVPLRVCPQFDPSEAAKADILFLTHSKITQREYLLYDKIFNGLGLKAACFDSEMYHGISKNAQTGKVNEWVGKFVGKPIIFPMKDQSDLALLNGSDIISHFHGSVQNEKEDKHESGLVIVGVAKNVAQFKETLKQQLYDSVSHTGTFEIPEKKLSDYFVMNSPTPELMTTRLEKIVSEYTTDQPSSVFTAFKTEYAPRKLNYMNLYTYGKAVIKQLPLSKVHRILLVTQGNETLGHNPLFLSAQLSKHANALVDKIETDTLFKRELERKEFHSDEKFFQVLLAILSVLSIEKKIQMLMEDYQEKMLSVQNEWEFLIDSEHNRKDSLTENIPSKRINIKDLIVVSLYNDLKVEYFYQDQGLGRTKRFCNFVKSNAHKFTTMNDALYRVWLVITRLVSHTYWRSLPYLSGSLTDKRTILLQLHEDLSKTLFNQQDIFSSTSNVEVMKQRAEKDAENKDRLKMEELQKIVLNPFL
jgi:hypothetical protein